MITFPHCSSTKSGVAIVEATCTNITVARRIDGDVALTVSTGENQKIFILKREQVKHLAELLSRAAG